MNIRSASWLFALSVTAACTTPGADGQGGARRSADCLYAVEMEYGLMTKWDSCTQPPANAVRCLNCDSRRQ